MSHSVPGSKQEDIEFSQVSVLGSKQEDIEFSQVTVSLVVSRKI